MDLSIYPHSPFFQCLALIGFWLVRMEASEARLGAAYGGGVSDRGRWYHGDGLYNDYEEVSGHTWDDALSAAGGRFCCLL